MPEFRAWQRSGIDSKERVLWIRGPLGIGKTYMAGYFIDLLRVQDPNAIVLYFFCKREGEKARLTKARDILRTLAYQYYDQSDHTVRSTLERLESKGFNIDMLPIQLVCESLLIGFLKQSNKDIYIVLDGVDEADRYTREIDVLIAQLATTKTARVLFISRPEANIAQAVPSVVIKSIGPTENKCDINAYVTQTVAQSESLRGHFAQAKVDPLKYFDEKANGIFLWVATVLKQLKKIRFSTTFGEQLDSLAETSGDMDELYTKVLASYDDKDRTLLKDVLTWVVFSFGYFDLPDLKSLVQSSLKTVIPTFQEFIEVDCGSILQLTRTTSTEGVPAVELIHETFLSYLLDQRRCFEAFYIDEVEAHATIFRVCLTALSTVEPLFSEEISEYAAKNWTEHQKKSMGSKFSVESVSAVCRFFFSQGCKLWIKYLDHRSFKSPFSWHDSRRIPNSQIQSHSKYYFGV